MENIFCELYMLKFYFINIHIIYIFINCTFILIFIFTFTLILRSTKPIIFFIRFFITLNRQKNNNKTKQNKKH